MNRETIIKFMTELKEFCGEHKDCDKCVLDDYCRIFIDNTKLPFKWKMPDKNKRWRAKKFENYWLVNTCRAVTETTENNLPSDDYCYNTHNYFRTKKEAEKYAKVLETEMRLKKFADEHNYKAVDWNNMAEDKWHLAYKYDTHEIGVYVTYLTPTPNTVYFNSSHIAREAIETIGEDRLVEYLTYEW